MKRFGLRLLSALWLPCWLSGSFPLEELRLDEPMLRDAMREEILDQIAQKAEAEIRHVYRLYDYLTNQAYDAIKNRLTPAVIRSAALKNRLREFYALLAEEEDLRQFRGEVNRYVQGMSIEIMDTLQIEYDRVLQLTEQVRKLNEWIERERAPSDPEAIARMAKNLDLPSRFLKRLESIEKKWKNTDEAEDSFMTFKTLKKNINGVDADEDPQLVFRLGDKYISQFPFIVDFLRQYERLGMKFLDAARKTQEMLFKRRSGTNRKTAINMIQYG
jgi:hypothetical protein